MISIVKLDKNGNFIWAKQSEQGNPSLCSDITATENGGFATVSNGCTWSQLITKFNSDGDILWQKYCPNDSQILTSLSFIIHNKDHSLVVSGVGGNTSYNGLCLFSLNSTGDLQWYKTFQFPGNIEHKGLIASLNGGYVLTGNANPYRLIRLSSVPVCSPNKYLFSPAVGVKSFSSVYIGRNLFLFLSFISFYLLKFN